MPFHRAYYPANWSELAHTAKASAGWRCAVCGARQGSLAVSSGNRLYRVVLSACHLDHDPENPLPRLATFCQPCHLRYDAFTHWRSRRIHARLQAVAAGQLQFGLEAVEETPAADALTSPLYPSARAGV
jgi:hypothetical protein